MQDNLAGVSLIMRINFVVSFRVILIIWKFNDLIRHSSALTVPPRTRDSVRWTNDNEPESSENN